VSHARVASLPLVAALLCAGTTRAETFERQVLAMGTRLTIAIDAADRGSAIAASEGVVEAIAETEARLSTWRDDSELSRLNATPVGVAVELSPATAATLARVLACERASSGAFDPTVGALVDAWDLRGAGRVPSARHLRQALASRGGAGLALAGRRATRRVAGLRVEEGAFGKGAGLDAAARWLRQQARVSGARLDFGGQVLILGSLEHTVAIAHPDRRDEAAATVRIASGSLATSGNGEARRWVDGRPIGHLLDPRSGAPAADFGSMTVWAEDALLADCLSTALFVMGPQRALEWRREHPELGIELLALERSAGSIGGSGGLIGWVSHGWTSRVRAVGATTATHGSAIRAPVSGRLD
jgi:thiamine biosynthesis lipoprotein